MNSTETTTSAPHGARVHALVRKGWLTNQHGAWAMMLVPILVGSILGGFTWPQALLTFAWLAAFFFFSALGLWIKVGASARKRFGGKPLDPKRKAAVARRQARYRSALITYASLAAVGALGLVLIKPDLVVWAPALAVCFGVAVWEMWRDADRSFLARASAVMASQLLTPIAFSLGSNPHDWARMWLATAVLTLYFVGTIPYVKTLIRERGSRAWIRGSIAYHGAVLTVAVVIASVGMLSWWIVALWVLLLVRSVAFPAWSNKLGKPLRPAIVGFTEFAVSTAVVLVLVLPATLS